MAMTRFLQELIAQHRTAAVAVLSVVAPLLYGHWFQSQSIWFLFLFVGFMLLLLIAAFVPARYGRLQMIKTLLPVIHSVLKLGPDDRITIHHLKSSRREKYEQLVDYYPQKFAGCGRACRI